MAAYKEILTSFIGNPDVDTPPSAVGKDGWSRIDKDSQGNIIKYISDGTNWILYDYSGFSFHSFRRKGTTENRWYIGGQVGNTALTSTAITANILYASPFIVPRNGLTISDIAINVITGVASTTAKIAIYKDNGNVYPGALVHDAGSIATDTSGVFASIAITPNKLLKPGGLYWFALSVNGSPTLRFVAIASQFTILGFNNTPGQATAATGYYKSNSYPVAGMLDPFPSAAQPNDGANIPAVYARFV